MPRTPTHAQATLKSRIKIFFLSANILRAQQKEKTLGRWELVTKGPKEI